MHFSTLRRALCVFLLLSMFSRLAAQELTFLGGGMSTRDLQLSSYTYQVDYRQNFTRFLAGSVAYINEGHIVGHHRDGTAAELWARLPLFNDRIALALGAGGYYFYDTQPLPNGDTANVHGGAVIYSGSVTIHLSGRWFVRAQANRISPTRQVKTNTAALGLGFWFGREKRPTKGKLGDAPDEYRHVTEPELTLFGGQSVVNTFLSQSALAYAAEYRQGLMPHVDWTVSAIYEGDPEIVRRNGLAAQAWLVNTFFDERFSVGIGLGPYVYLDRKNPRSGGIANPAAAAPLLSLSMATRVSDHWIIRLMLDRVTTSYNRDADIFLAGLGYRWGAGTR